MTLEVVEPNRSNRREYVEAEKGGAGIPVNSCTIALKLEVSVVRTVVGALLEARVRFFGFFIVWFRKPDRGGVGLSDLSEPGPTKSRLS